MVSQSSRYYGVGIAVLVLPGGEEIQYLKRRFLQDPDRETVLSIHTVSEGERPDIIAAKYLGDPELFWRVCDANATMSPDELTRTPGRLLNIPLITGG